MDSVLKHVQGSYIVAFQHNINFIMHLVYQHNVHNKDYIQKLVKIFKTWQVLGLFSGLDEISRSLNFAQLVSSLWTHF